jgi:predicted transcriptional regulator
MYLDAFDRRIVDVLRVEDRSMRLAELVKAAGFARSTVIIHLERLMSEGLVLREKRPSGGRGRPKFMYSLIKKPEFKATFQQALSP